MRERERASGADLGGQTPPPQAFDPLANQRVPPLVLFFDISFLPIDPKNFRKALLTPIYSNFEGERAPKKTHFIGHNVPKNAQKRLFRPVFFFKNLLAAQKLFSN